MNKQWVGWPLFAIEIACPQVLAQSSAWESNILRLVRISEIAKHGLQYEKAVKRWCGPDAMVKGQKEAMLAE
jgi:hypothetical protein